MSQPTIALPPSHPPVEPHEHKGLECPLTKSRDHSYCPPQQGDSRSVCPALNAMANHGYIPRDGKGLSFRTINKGLQECYNLSTPLSVLLTFGGFLLTKTLPKLFGGMDLFHFGLHGGVEHNASLVHRDCPATDKYAPVEVVVDWAANLVGDVEPKIQAQNEVTGALVNEEDVARMRVRREKESPLGAFHAEIARGETAIILGVWERTVNGKTGIPLPHLLDWLVNEKLPEGWKPDHVQGLLDVVGRSKKIRAKAESIRSEENLEK